MESTKRTCELPDTALAERLARSTNKTDTCWTWTGEITPKGYGVLQVNGRRVLAHRASYEAHVGPVPEGLVIDHVCHDKSCIAGDACPHRRCINPAHLQPVTNAVNILRGVGVGAVNAQKTHCIRGHEFTPENILRQPPNWPGGPDRRSCRTCRREQNREAMRARRARTRAQPEPLADA
ncbi:HNH endonuclease signature motif containing protein [Streptomyces sp. NPDC097640]|uniref:HNH endonuclease signature motif containing protein n=1 Tax=Streptomyces sp. NPDC097640 TaxID=3157229 RepID=UPI0033165C1D